MAVPDQEVTIKVNPKVGIGLSSIVGFGAAAAQYLAVVIGLLEDGEMDSEELGVLASATATLIATLYGRMKQAAAAITADGQVSNRSTR